MFPNFLCVGAHKAGTTTLFEILKQHPDIYLPDSKEAQFFTRPHLYDFSSALYELRNFAAVDQQAVVGEMTPGIMYLPEAPQQLYELLGPEIKLIFVLRHPVERAYSHYRNNYGDLVENETFEDALALEPGRIRQNIHFNLLYSYIHRGFYGEQIQRFLTVFPKSNMFFLISENGVFQEANPMIQKLFAFLNVSPHPVNTALSANTGEEAWVEMIDEDKIQTIPPHIQLAKDTIAYTNRLKARLQIDVDPQENRIFCPAGSILVKLRNRHLKIVTHPTGQFRAYIEKHLENVPSGKLTPDQKAALLNQYFDQDIRLLETLIDQDLSLWHPGRVTPV